MSCDLVEAFPCVFSNSKIQNAQRNLRDTKWRFQKSGFFLRTHYLGLRIKYLKYIFVKSQIVPDPDVCFCFSSQQSTKRLINFIYCHKQYAFSYMLHQCITEWICFQFSFIHSKRRICAKMLDCLPRMKFSLHKPDVLCTKHRSLFSKRVDAEEIFQ